LGCGLAATSGKAKRVLDELDDALVRVTVRVRVRARARA